MSEFWGWLGGRSVREKPVGNKAGLLDIAARKGLPVPKGFVIFHEALEELVRQGAFRWGSDDHDAKRIARVLNLPKLSGLVAVRSAFSAEDALHQSFAGYFESVLNVDPNDETAFAAALAKVWESSTRYKADFRLDVIVMQMVLAEYAGVAFTEYEFEDDLVNFTEGTAEGLVGGAEPGTVEDIPKLRHWEHPDPEMPGAFRRRLQGLLRELRNAFGGENWDVEWADDGQVCSLIQVRPITTPTRRNEAFTIANHKEILPELPSRLMATLIVSCSAGLFDYYRRFDPWLPAGRSFTELFAGRPLINLSLLSEMMRAWGLPTRLVTDSIGGRSVRPVELNRGRLIRKLPMLARQGTSHLVAPWRARRAGEDLIRRCGQPGESFTACVRTMQWAYTRLVTEMFGLTAAMSLPLAVLRRQGTLARHSVDARSPGSDMADSLDRLRAFVAGDREALAALQAGEVPNRADFRAEWESFLLRFGHRAAYESDIARPRYADDPSPLLRSLASPALRRIVGGSDEPKPKWTSALIWKAARRPMLARERLRDRAMVAFAAVRRQIMRMASQATERGALPHPDRVWDLSVEEIGLLDQGWTPPQSFWDRRDQELSRLNEIRLPDLIHRFDDVEAPLEAAYGVNRFTGVGLTSGIIEGQAWVLEEPSISLPEGFSPASTVLVARSVDAGWVPTFALVAGVVAETGGDLSHGSIILRELGLPAVTNAHGVIAGIESGERIRLNARSGLVEKVARTPVHA